MANRPVLLLATLETKSDEARYLRAAIEACDITVETVDLSLGLRGDSWNDERKIKRISDVAHEVSSRIDTDCLERFSAIIGLGGGTGGEIILRILRTLPFDFPKFLITTLPFDPRVEVADNSIVMIPTVADIEGLNSSLRLVLDNTAHMLAGLASRPTRRNAPVKSIGLTTLGVTRTAGKKIMSRLRMSGHETTAFHANGYGGAAFARFSREGAFSGVIDMTVHEITRIHVAGAHVAMPDRFTAAGDIPRVVLPGGLNFIGLGEMEQVHPEYLERPHYRHSGYFTHVKMSPEEMERACVELSDALNQASVPTVVIMPMGGFSNQDCPGGVIEDRSLRDIAAECLEGEASSYQVIRLDAHINDGETADLSVKMLWSALGKGTMDA